MITATYILQLDPEIPNLLRPPFLSELELAEAFARQVVGHEHE
jgi:hypothetical protein